MLFFTVTNPDDVARKICERTGCEASVMDINDIGGSWALGASDGVDRMLLEEVMRDNPVGQKDEITPVALVRVIETETPNQA